MRFVGFVRELGVVAVALGATLAFAFGSCLGLLSLGVLHGLLPDGDVPFSAIVSAGSVSDLGLMLLDLELLDCIFMLLMSVLSDIGSGRVAIAAVVVGAVGVGNTSLGINGPPMFGIRGSRIRIACTALFAAVRNCTDEVSCK